MKRHLILIVLLLAGCKTLHRSSNTDQHIDEKSTSQTAAYEQHSQLRDSQSSGWYFHTDSLFYFHPNKGLSSYGGTVYYQQSQRRSSQKEISLSKTDSAMSTLADSRIKTIAILKDKPLIMKLLLLIAFMFFCYFVSLKYFKKKS